MVFTDLLQDEQFHRFRVVLYRYNRLDSYLIKVKFSIHFYIVEGSTPKEQEFMNLVIVVSVSNQEFAS
jgi:hypothetical protein